LAQQSTSARSPQQKDNKVQPPGKILVSSVVTHASLLAAISERNPIVASRTEPDRETS
jgi:hypothetical protein